MSARNPLRRVVLVAFAALGGFAGLLALAAGPAGAFVGYPSVPNAVFGASGSSNGQFSTPLGVAVDDSSGDVYVVDQGNGRVERFDAEGAFLGQLTGAETPAGSLSAPGSVAVDDSSSAAKGDVYVTDVGHGVIDVFGSNGKYLSQIVGTPSSFAGELLGVAVDAAGDPWVYDATGNVYEFSDTGALLSQFNTGRSADHGFAIDSSDNVYVLLGCGCVGKYDAAGSQLAEWGVGQALAVNESTGNVFLDTSSAIEESGPGGEPYGISTEAFGEGSISGSRGIAVNGKTGAVYASQSEADTVAIFKAALLADVSTESAGTLTITEATLHGVVDPDGKEVTTCEFEYGTDTSYGQTAACSPAPGSGSSSVPVSAEIGGLTSASTYHYRLVAGNANGLHRGADETFTTKTSTPLIGEQTVSSVTRLTATVSAQIDPEKSPTTYEILYGETSRYGEHSAEAEAGSGLEEETVHVGLLGLAPGMTYHYAVQASNQAGTVTGPDQTFTTAPPTPPSAITGGASDVALTTATVSGTIAPNGLETSYELDVGTDASYGTSIYGEAGSGTEGIEVALALQNLAPDTTYHYRLVAINSDGTVYGSDQTFTTPVYSNPIILPSTLPLVGTPAIAFPTETEPTQKAAEKQTTKEKTNKKRRQVKKTKGRGKAKQKIARKKKK